MWRRVFYFLIAYTKIHTLKSYYTKMNFKVSSGHVKIYNIAKMKSFDINFNGAYPNFDVY